MIPETPIPAVMSRGECQEALFAAAVEVARLDKWLAEIAAAIQLPPNLEAMDDLDVPLNVEAQIFSSIGAVKTDYLQKTVKVLLRAAQINDLVLRHEYQRIYSSQSYPKGGRS